MTLTELKYAIAVATEQHFGRAAKACGISQPTLSVAIRKLETELGVKLFERNNADVITTPIGRVVVRQAERVLSDVNLIRECVKESLNPETQVLRLGLAKSVSTHLAKDLMAKLHALETTLPVYLTEKRTTTLLDELRAGSIDCVIAAEPLDEVGFVKEPLYEEDFVALLSVNHPYAEKERLTVKDVKEADKIMLLSTRHINICPLDKLFEENDLLHSKVEYATSLETLIEMVKENIAFTLLPKKTALHYRAETCLRLVPLEHHALTRRVSLYWRKTFTRLEAIHTLIQAMRSLAPSNEAL